MPELYSPDRLRFCASNGATYWFEAGETKEIPEALVKEALAAGCRFPEKPLIPEGKVLVDMPVDETIQATIDKGIYAAVMKVVDAGKKADFYASNNPGQFIPKVKSVKAHLESDVAVSSDEIFNAFTHYMAVTGRVAIVAGRVRINCDHLR